MEILTARLQGGLGNQMFIAATGALLARRLNRALVLDVAAFEADPQRDFALGHFEAFARLPTTSTAFSKRQRARDAARRLAGFPDQNLFRQTGFDYDPRFETIASCDRMSGYFQSRRYVGADPDFVRSLFLDGGSSGLQDFVRSQVGEQFIGVHVRRGDYLQARNQDVHGVCDANYYVRAIQLVRSMGAADLPIVSFTESVAELPDSLRGMSDVVIEDSGDRPPSEDLLALAGASSIVLSNSSFSWWAAFLGGNAPERKVVAPRPWMRRGDIAASDLLFPEWISIGASG